MRELEAMIMIPLELCEISYKICESYCFDVLLNIIEYCSIQFLFNFLAYPEFELRNNLVEENLKFFNPFYKFSI